MIILIVVAVVAVVIVHWQVTRCVVSKVKIVVTIIVLTLGSDRAVLNGNDVFSVLVAST